MSPGETFHSGKTESAPDNSEDVKMAYRIKPLVWSFKLYDNHLAPKFRNQPDVHELARRVRGETPRRAPLPLPRIRKRALTNPLPPMESMQSISSSVRRSQQTTSDQMASMFLTRLPFEIRLEIYEDVLASKKARLIHVLRKHGRLGHWHCRIHNDGLEICDEKGNRCLEGWLSHKAKLWHLEKNGMIDLKTDDGLLSILLTCRMIYSEAIGILYAKNIFHFHDPGDIRFFSRTILPRRLNTVHSLVIDWERPFSIFSKDNTMPKQDDEECKAWEEAWGIIKNMEGLQHLKVLLKSHRFKVSNDRRRKMCQPMMEIMSLRTFDLVIPFDNGEDWNFAADAPFKIVRGADSSGEQVSA